MWSSGAGSSGSSAAAAALASPSSSARACGVRAPRPVRPSIAASSTDQATSGPCAAGRRGRSQRTRATRDGTPVPEARPSPAGRAATWLSAIRRVSTRCGSTSPGERAFSVLPAASRDPTAPDVRGLASQARVRSVQRSAADFRAHASYPSVGSQLSGSSPGAPTASSPAVAASSTTKRGGALVDVQQQRERAQVPDPEAAGPQHRRRSGAPVVQQQLDPTYGVERRPGRRPRRLRGVVGGGHQLRGYVDRSRRPARAPGRAARRPR